MPFNWQEYLHLAHFLAAQSGANFSREACSGSAVSRAYYATYCYARNYARDRQGFRPKYTARDHVEVREHFQDRGMTGIALKLAELRQWRNSCDYDDIHPNVSLLLSSALREAQDVINGLV